MRDSTRRAGRTGLDLIIGTLTALGAIFLIPGIDEQMEQLGLAQVFMVFGLIVLVLTVFFTKLKNALEDKGSIPALGKAPASDGADPVPNKSEGRI